MDFCMNCVITTLEVGVGAGGVNISEMIKLCFTFLFDFLILNDI